MTDDRTPAIDQADLIVRLRARASHAKSGLEYTQGDAELDLEAIAALESMASALSPSHVEKLRRALIECGRAAGALLSDQVSNEFLLLVPEEVRARLAKLSAPIPHVEQARETEVRDTDLVCTACRWRAGHAPDCPRRDEPWPTIKVPASPLPVGEERLRKALEEIHGIAVQAEVYCSTRLDPAAVFATISEIARKAMFPENFSSLGGQDDAR